MRDLRVLQIGGITILLLLDWFILRYFLEGSVVIPTISILFLMLVRSGHVVVKSIYYRSLRVAIYRGLAEGVLLQAFSTGSYLHVDMLDEH